MHNYIFTFSIECALLRSLQVIDFKGFRVSQIHLSKSKRGI